jgi:hypothetical protein
MLKYVLLATIVVVLICVIYYVFYGSDRAKRRRARQNIRSSSGVFDKAAAAALSELSSINAPTADDLAAAADIYRYNILEDNVHVNTPEEINALENAILNYQLALLTVTEAEEPDHILRRVEEFNDRLTRTRFNDQDLDAMVTEFTHTAEAVVPQARRDVIQQRAARARKRAETRREAINEAIDEAITYTNDSQNVHDTSVNADLRETLAKLKQGNGGRVDIPRAFAEAEQFIRGKYAADPDNREKVAQALAVLAVMSRGEYIYTYNDTESNIFAHTWARAKHPRNIAREDLIKTAIVNALADSVENGNIVCVNGRCGRVLNSLVTLDFDPSVGSAMTFEAYRNQIFQEVKEIIDKEIDKAKNSGDAELAEYAKSFDSGDPLEDGGPAEERFKRQLKNSLDKHIDSYRDKLGEREIEQVRQEAYVYAMI